MAHHEHALDIVGLGNLVFRQQCCVMPTGRWNARGVHQRRRVKAAFQPLEVFFPDTAPVPPCRLGEAVVERQGHDIEAEIGRALNVGMTAENIGAHARTANVACCQQQDAARANVCGTNRMLRLTHRPDETRRFVFSEFFGDALELLARHTADALDFLRRILFDLLADVIHAVNALLDELLVFPAILEDMPEHSIEHRDVRTGAKPHIFGRMRTGSCHARIANDEIGAVELFTFEKMLQRHRVRFGGIAAEEQKRL